MKEQYSGDSTARGVLKVVGKGALKALMFTYQGINAYQRGQGLKRKAEVDTALAVAAMSAGGFVDRVPGGLLINDELTFVNHEGAKRASALSSAAALALKATEQSPKLRINDIEVSESSSFLIVDSEHITRIQLKSSDQYSLINMKNFDEWTVSPTPVTDPSSGETLIPYYGKGYHAEVYNSASELVSSGGGSYFAVNSRDDATERATFEFKTASEYMNRVTQEIAQAAYSDLVAQGGEITDGIQKTHEHATAIQPAIYYKD